METKIEKGLSKTSKPQFDDNCIARNDYGISIRSILLFLLSTLASGIVLEFYPLSNIGNGKLVSFDMFASREDGNSLKFAIYGRSKTEDHLVHVFNVLNRFGYKRTTLEENNWNLLWAHDYPFLNLSLKNLTDNQMVNHFPGCGFITTKVNLCTTRLPFLPRAFRLPEQSNEFLSYSRQNPGSLFVEKHNEHRHIRIRAPDQVNLNSNDSFVQEYIQNPFLVDGHKFDIGIYVVITSVSPLRVYIYTGDVLFRYCPVKYYPFDETIVDKYVVGDDYMPTWELPSLKKYYNRFGGSMRETFDAYVRDQYKDPTDIWLQVEHIIRTTILAKEDDLTRILRPYKSGKFFELMRFDLIIDDKLKVHLMEANMSPNLSSAHFKPNSLLYEQVLYSVLNLVGIGSPIRRRASLSFDSSDIEQMLTADKNLATDLNLCTKFECEYSCNLDECSLCLPCLSGSEYEILEKAHREHLHRIDMKRVVPRPIYDLKSYDVDFEIKDMTKRNKWMSKWFYNKCKYDQSWCL